MSLLKSLLFIWKEVFSYPLAGHMTPTCQKEANFVRVGNIQSRPVFSQRRWKNNKTMADIDHQTRYARTGFCHYRGGECCDLEDSPSYTFVLLYLWTLNDELNFVWVFGSGVWKLLGCKCCKWLGWFHDCRHWVLLVDKLTAVHLLF